MKPEYLQLSPLTGELVWKTSPSDELLSFQSGYFRFLENHWSANLLDFRMGFTRISLVWKDKQAHLEFLGSFPSLDPKPIPLSEKIWEVPVCYESVMAPDLLELAEGKQLTISQFVELHTSPYYRIHFFGFLPGFFYLNGLPEILHAPRKSVPSRSVPRGSVAIGGSQTGIYPGESPGGWHLIGRTPVSLFNSQTDPPVWARPGERIKFVPISASQYQKRSFSKPNLLKG